MDNTVPPPAPPPLQPNTPSHNPYDFIVNPNLGAKNNKFSLGKSKQSKILLITIGALLLVVVATIIYGFISGAGSSQSQAYTDALQQQAEIIRLADIGVSKAKSPNTKNFALTTKLTMESDQLQLNKLAIKAGIKSTPKLLAEGKDIQINASLKSAEQTNQFDALLISTLEEKLQTYQQTIKSLHESTSKQETKKILSDQYQNIDTLLKK